MLYLKIYVFIFLTLMCDIFYYFCKLQDTYFRMKLFWNSIQIFVFKNFVPICCVKIHHKAVTDIMKEIMSIKARQDIQEKNQAQNRSDNQDWRQSGTQPRSTQDRHRDWDSQRRNQTQKSIYLQLEIMLGVQHRHVYL